MPRVPRTLPLPKHWPGFTSALRADEGKGPRARRSPESRGSQLGKQSTACSPTTGNDSNCHGGTESPERAVRSK